MAENNDKPSQIYLCKKLVKCVEESNTKMNNIVEDMALGSDRAASFKRVSIVYVQRTY